MKKTIKKTEMKKGEVQVSILMYVLSMLIIGLVLFFGIKSVYKLVRAEEDISLVKFTNSLDSSITKIKGVTFSAKEETFYVPGDFDNICFVSSSCLELNSTLCELGNVDEILLNSVDSKNKKNIFFRNNKNMSVDFYYNPDIIVDSQFGGGLICIPVLQNTLKIKMEGYAKKTKVFCSADLKDMCYET